MAKNRIKEARTARGISQRALAEKLGAHWVTVSKLERGDMQLTMDWITRVSEALSVPITELIEFQNRDYFIDLHARLDGNGNVVRVDKAHSSINIGNVVSSDTFSFWIYIDGMALWPLFRPGDFAKFLQIPAKQLAEEATIRSAYGRPCLVLQNDGSELLGLFGPPYGDGVASVRPMNGLPVELKEIAGLAVLYEARFSPALIPASGM